MQSKALSDLQQNDDVNMQEVELLLMKLQVGGVVLWVGRFEWWVG